MPEIGFRFQPGVTDSRMQPLNGEGQGTTVPQESIRTLSLRVPQTTSVPGVAPLPLLNAFGGGGSDLDMLLKALLRAFGPNALQGDMSRGPGGGRIATPRVTPRITPGYAPDESPTEFPDVPLPPTPESGVFRTPRWRAPQDVPPSAPGTGGWRGRGEFDTGRLSGPGFAPTGDEGSFPSAGTSLPEFRPDTQEFRVATNPTEMYGSVSPLF